MQLFEDSIYSFCIEFYTLLVSGETVLQSFRDAKEIMIQNFRDHNYRT
jgi:hypothetical protein